MINKNKLVNKFRSVVGIEKVNYLDQFATDLRTKYDGDFKKGILQIKDRHVFNQLVREIKEVHRDKHRNHYDWFFTITDVLFIIFALMVPLLQKYLMGEYDDELKELNHHDPKQLSQRLREIHQHRKEVQRFLIICRSVLIVLMFAMWYLFKKKLQEYEYCTVWHYSNPIVLVKLGILFNLLGVDLYHYWKKDEL